MPDRVEASRLEDTPDPSLGAIGDAAPDFLTRFAEIVKLRGDHIGVEAPEGKLSYAELDRISDCLAHQLSRYDVAPGCRVGISLPRGACELVAMLATSKAGGAYVPLDPAQPPDRLNNIIEDAAPQVLIVQSGSPLAGTSGPIVLHLDGLDDINPEEPERSLDLEYDPSQAAYIMFTSGSTGRPKGVEVPRGALANFLRSMAHTPGLSQDDRLMAITPTSFDISGLELFLPLWVGATVVIVDRDTSRSAVALRRRIEEESISVLQATPATWRLLLDAGWKADPGLRLLCGGEALYPELAKRLLAHGNEVWNLYGPTETTIWSSLEKLQRGLDRVTIGTPIDHTQMYVLDENLVPVPDGDEGELCIGGRGLANGYFGLPELTEEKFVALPGPLPGARIYRTGDLARKLDDGRFECLGRLDDQVKIRGFRVELGEIETVLRAVPGVQEVVVIADEDEDHDQRLLAYYVGTAGRDALIEQAQRKLPAHIIPSAFVALESIPLNTSNKIDRKKLPRPQSVFSEGQLAAQRPRTHLETCVAGICSEVLGIPHIGLDEDFFMVGGTSIRAAEVVSLIQAETGIELPPQLFFVAPTVAGIAAQLESSFSPDDPAVAMLREGPVDATPLWCVLGISIYRHLAHALDEERPVFGVHVPFRSVSGPGGMPSIYEVAKGYVAVIRAHQKQGPYQLLGMCFGGIVAYEAARQLEAAGERVELVTVIDALVPEAIRVDRSERLGFYVRQPFEHPIEFGQKLLGIGTSWFRSRLPWRSAATERAEMIDLQIDGPAADSEIARFFSRAMRLTSPLLIARATDEPQPTWIQLASDHGWGKFADRLLICDIKADHLETLRAPHVRVLADAIADALGAPPLEHR